jgi:PKD repeat protein
LSKKTLFVLVTLALLSFAPVAVGATPTGELTITPAPPDRANIGEPVTFQISNIDWGGTAGTVAWSFGDGTQVTPEVETTHAYTAAGSYQAAAILTNGAGEVGGVAAKAVRVNAPPTVVFSGFNPVAPLPGVDVLFASDSTDPDGDAITHLWDFGDGATSPNRNALHAFASAGTKNVTLTVTDPFGASDTKTEQVGLLVPQGPVDQLPRAGFAFAPGEPEVGDPVQFVSTSVDPEDKLRSQTWDLDGDGEFDDGRGDELLYTFTSAGEKRVRLRVEDAAGNSVQRERSVKVRTAPPPPPGYMRPWPNISFNGTVLSTGMRVRSLGIRAPAGALVSVTCRGKGCSVKQRRKRVKRGLVHFKTYETFLRAGVRLEIFVRKSGTIGRYKRYTIRAGKFPTVRDLCLEPDKRRPTRCR